MPQQDPIALSVKGVKDLVSSGLNKMNGGVDNLEGPSGDHEDVLTLKLDDEKLLRLANRVEALYTPYEGKIRPRQSAMRNYYLGKQNGPSPSSQEYPIAANLIFEAAETFYPAALSKNPEPVVWSDNTTEGEQQASSVKTMLQYHADVLVFRRKLNRMARQWSVDLLGVMKHGWDPKVKDITLETRDVKKFIFHPDGYIDEYGDYRGPLLGERITVPAERLLELFPKHTAFISVMVDGQLGTPCTYTEWRSDEYTFITFKNKVLAKNKNEFFNYPEKAPGIDQDGNAVETETTVINHFGRPKMPYTFLSVFSFGDHPHDDTGLIEQNIPNQNRIAKRETQIDNNLDKGNNSLGLSGANFNEETARQAATAMQKGNPIIIPSGGPISEAVSRFPAPDLPSAMFQALETSKNDLRGIFGTQGITAQRQDEDQTARGMILNQQYDNTRIGGGIGDALEQVADNVFNWWVQLYCVFYDEPHYAAILGQTRGVEYVQFQASDLKRRMVVSVAPNSMKPKDEVTEMNQAMALFDKGVMDPKTLYTILDFPDPQKTAEQAVLWRLDPASYMRLNFPELAAQLAQAAAQAAPQPGQGPAPEAANGEPPPQEGISTPPASAGLDQVPLSQPAA